MMMKVLVVLGVAGVGYLVQMATALITQNMYLAVLAGGVFAFWMGIAASRDGLWRD